LDPGSRRAQLQGVADVVQLLSGFEAAAGAWEAELLARRVNEYESAWLDQHGVAGTVSWARLSLSASPRALLLRSTPVALMPRAELKLWLRVARQGKPVPELSGRAERVRAFIERHGASFFDDLAAGVGLIASEVEAALAELIAAGCVHADGFSALRSLILPTERRAPRRAGLSRQQRAGGGVAGRWARLPLDVSEPPSDEDHTRIAHILLRRYGVVFRRVLDREEGLPAWRNILWALRRLEMAGEVRGGRFVDGHAGEQFALPDAVGLLREVRHRAVGDEILTVSAADPLNLSGILTPGVRIPSIGQHRLALLEGVPVAVQTGAEIRLLENLEADVACRVRTALIDRRAQRYTYRGMRNG
jgi:ATP-dependent Lhr-like helicase